MGSGNEGSLFGGIWLVRFLTMERSGCKVCISLRIIVIRLGDEVVRLKSRAQFSYLFVLNEVSRTQRIRTDTATLLHSVYLC